MLKLYGYYRSSAAYRVRIALELKSLNWESVPVNLQFGEQKNPLVNTTRRDWFRYWSQAANFLLNPLPSLSTLRNCIPNLHCYHPVQRNEHGSAGWLTKLRWRCTP